MSVRGVLHPKRLRQTSQFCWSLVLLGEWPVLIDRVETLLTTFSYRLSYKFCYLGPAQLRRDNVMVARDTEGYGALQFVEDNLVSHTTH